MARVTHRERTIDVQPPRVAVNTLTTTDGENVKPPVFVRMLAALTIGGLSGALCAIKAAKSVVTTDFEFFWRASRLFAQGINPYLLKPGDPGWPLPDALYYPAPALLVMWPLQHLTLAVAAGLFFGGSSAWLAWRLSESGVWRLWLFGSPAFIIATILGQWSPLMTVAALVPGAAFLLACKPNIGLACFAYRPTWRGAIGVLAVCIVALAFLPTWPADWLANVRIVADHPVADHPSPILKPLGWILILALTRWRQPEARLLIAMACVPQLLYFADQLPLGLVARKRGEAVALAACGIVAGLMWFVLLPEGAPHVAPAARYVMLGVYLPALVVVLRRPNEGKVPAWLEAQHGRARRAVTGLPGMFRSRTACTDTRADFRIAEMV